MYNIFLRKQCEGIYFPIVHSCATGAVVNDVRGPLVPIITPHVCLMVVLGVVLGIIGFVPLLLVVRMVGRGLTKPSISKGLAAVGVSFAFLMAIEAAVWILAPDDCLIVLAGMLVGFFGMWAVLAYLSMKHRF